MKKILKEMVLNSKLGGGVSAFAIWLFALTAAFQANAAASGTLPWTTPIMDADYYVGPSGSDSNAGTRAAPFATLGKAYSSASAGNTICLLAGTYNISATFDVQKNLTIIGEEGWTKTVIRQTASVRAVRLRAGATLKGVTVTGGKTSDAGAGVRMADGTLSWCCISNNTMSGSNVGGAGVSFTGGKGTVDHSIIANNSADGYGAGIGSHNGTLTGSAVIDTCLIYGNSAGSGGGLGFSSPGQPVTVRNCTIADNTSANNAAGVYFAGSGTLNLVNDIVSNNSAGGVEKNVSVGASLLGSASNCIITGTATGSDPYQDATLVSTFGLSSASPAFAGSGDYHLSATSPAIGAGVTTDTTTDLDNNAYATPRALGCYESTAAREWTATAMSASGDTVRTDGTLVYAYCRGTQNNVVTTTTVNGVPFSGYYDNGDFKNKQSDVRVSPAFNGWQGSLGNEGLSSDYGTLLNNGFSLNSGYETTTFTLNGLTSGKRYLFQLITHKNSSSYTVSAGGVTVSAGGDGWQYGGSLVREFTAASASETFALTCAGGLFVMNGIQVRDLSSSPTTATARYSTDGGTSWTEVADVDTAYAAIKDQSSAAIIEVLANGAIFGSDYTGAQCDITLRTKPGVATCTLTRNAAQDAGHWYVTDGKTLTIADLVINSGTTPINGMLRVGTTKGSTAKAYLQTGCVLTSSSTTCSGEAIRTYGELHIDGGVIREWYVSGMYCCVVVPLTLSTTYITAGGIEDCVSTKTDSSSAVVFGGGCVVGAQHNVTDPLGDGDPARTVLYMSGGYIRNNRHVADTVGSNGIIGCSYPRTFYSITGGEITGNTSANGYLGVFYNAKPLLSGSPVIANNLNANVTCNIYVYNLGGDSLGSKVKIAGNLTAGANVGVYSPLLYSVGDVFAEGVPEGFTGTECIHNDRNPQLSVSIVDGKNLCWAGQTYAVSWSGGANATTVATVGGTAIASGAQVEDGKSVVFTVTPNTGYEFAEASYADWTKTDGVLTRTVPVNGAAVTVTIPGATEIVPMFYVGSQGYSSWEAAYDAVEAGGTIKVGANAVIEMDSSMSCAKAVMIDLNGNTLTWNPGGWVYTTFTFVDSSAGHAGVLSLPSGTRNITDSTFDLTLLTSSQLTGAGQFKAATATTVVKFPSDMPLAACTPYVVNQVVGTSIVVQGNTYTWDGSKWARPTVAPSIGSLTVTPSGANVSFALADVVMGTDSTGEPATEYTIYYAVTNTFGVEIKSGTVCTTSSDTYMFNVTGFDDGNYTCGVKITTDVGKVATKPGSFTINTTPVLTPGWEAVPMTSGGNAIRTEGVLLYAYMRGLTKGETYAVNTVPFTGLGAGNLCQTSLSEYAANGVQFEYGTGMYRDWHENPSSTDPFEMMMEVNWRGSAGNRDLTLKGLYPGNLYLVQLVIKSTEHGDESVLGSNQDSSTTSSPDGNATAHAYGSGWEYGGSLVGIFEATGTTQTFTLNSSNMALVNAIQVREVSQVETITKIDGESAADTRNRIQRAIDRAAPTHRTVNLGPGLFEIDVSLKVTNGVSLVGQGWDKTIIKQTGVDRVAIIDGGAKVIGVTATGGRTTSKELSPNNKYAPSWEHGAGFDVWDGTVSWCCITNNKHTSYNNHGGGIHIDKGTIDHCIIANNSAGSGSGCGGGIACRGDVTKGPVLIDTCLIYGNTSPKDNGGGISIDNVNPDITIRNTTITANTAASGKAGGGVYANSSAKKVKLINSIVSENTLGDGSASDVSVSSGLAVDSGNIVSIDPGFVNAAANNYHLADASGAAGNGVTYDGIGIDLDRVAFAASPSVGCYEYVGTGIKREDTPAKTRKTIQDAIDAVAPAHGIVHLAEGLFEIDAQLYVTNGVTLTGQGYEKTVVKYSGSTGGFSRVIYIPDSGTLSHLTLTGGYLDHNNAMGAGVFINENAESATISWCCITNNINNRNAGGGIAFYKSKGTFRIDHTVLSGNVACKGWATGNIGGGAIGGSLASGSMLEIDTCLITSNRTVKTDTEKPWLSAGGGIGVYCADDKNTCTVRIVNTTVADNSAGGPGGGLYLGKTVNGSLVNDIFTDNTAAVTAGAGDANVAFVSDTVKAAVAAKTSNCFFANEAGAFGRDALYGNVRFADAADGDYHLSEISPAIAGGLALGASRLDLDEKEFGVIPSIGCYEYASFVTAPTFDPVSRTRITGASLSVRIFAQKGYTIRYTLDGTLPTESSTLYGGAFTVAETTTVKARAYDGDGNASAVASAIYLDSDTSDYYVSLNGSDENNGWTPETAFRTIEHAIDVAKAGQKVFILPGTFLIDAQLTVTNAITITGSGWDNTIIKASKKGFRIVELAGGAKLEHVTLTGAYLNTTDGVAGSGAGAQITDGTLSWCCITNNESMANSNRPVGGGVSFKGGRGQIDHCIVAKNKSSTGSYGCGIGANSESGSSITGPVLIDTCLVYGNVISSGSGGGIAFRKADYDVTIRNCTITGNSDTANAGGLRLENGSGTVTVINTILAGNLKSGVEKNLASNRTGGGYGPDVFSNCFFGLEDEAKGKDATCAWGAVNFAKAGDYHPNAAWTDVVGKGVTYAGIGETLDGTQFQEKPSMGCYEPTGGFSTPVITYPDKHEALATTTIFALKAGMESADVTFAYGEDPKNLSTPVTIATGATTGQPLSGAMTGLEAGGTYYYCFTATGNGESFTYSGWFIAKEWDVLAFSTLKSVPNSRGAEVSVTIMKLGAGATKAEVWLAWGPDSEHLTESRRVSTTAIEKQTVSFPISGLGHNEVCVFRFTGTNDVGDVAQRYGTFTTLDVEHLELTPVTISEVAQNSAKLSTTVKTVGEEATKATVTLKWGTTQGSWENTETLTSVAIKNSVVSKMFSGLTANTLYYYELVAENDASGVDHASVTMSGAFWTADPNVKEEDRSDDYPEDIPAGKVVTYDADNAGNPETLEAGSPFTLVDEATYTLEKTGCGKTYHFRDAWDFQYNASARIGNTYYLFLKDAVDAAAAGDTIELLRNNYAVEDTIVIDKVLTINGNGYAVKVAEPFLNAQGYVVASPSPLLVVIHIANGGDAKLSNMTVMGGGTYVSNYKYLISAVVVGASAGVGVERTIGGSNGILDMDHVTIMRSQGGLNVAAYTKVHMTACNIVRNARGCGGGFYNRGLVVMDSSSLSENRSLLDSGGGAACENQGALFMNNCVICNNGSTEYGGAINMIASTSIDGKQTCYCYMMNMTMAGNFTSHSTDCGGGIGIHHQNTSGVRDIYMINCILCNDYWYSTSKGSVTSSDIVQGNGNNNFLYSVYGKSSGGKFSNCVVIDPDPDKAEVFKGYTPFKRIYQATNQTSCDIPGPTLSSDPSQPLARYAPLKESGSKADWGNDGVYTYFDDSDWRSWEDTGDANAIKMSYKTASGEMTALGNCEAADESKLVTTYYETAFVPNVTDRELGVVGASGFGTFKNDYTLFLVAGHETDNGSVSDNLTIQGTTYPEGTEVTVVATPTAKCSFIAWRDENNAFVSDKSSYTMVMDSDKWLWAEFSEPSDTHTFLRIKCEQQLGTHGLFPITITADWLKKTHICDDGIPKSPAAVEVVEGLLNAPDTVNGLNHVWMNYVLGGMMPGDPDGRTWLKGEQTSDNNTIKFSQKQFAETSECGFRVRYRVATKDIGKNEAEFDRSRPYYTEAGKSTTFYEDITKDLVDLRVIDMIFIPTGHVSSFEFMTTVNTAGVMKVESEKKFEILASPWVEFSSSDEASDISALNYVKSGCLTAGDVLYVYDYENSCYSAWKSTGGGWDPLSTYQIENGLVKKLSGTTPEDGVVPRGQGTWLERKNPAATPIYLYGQYDPSSVTTTLAPGFNLVASPSIKPFDASKLAKPAITGQNGDHLVIPTGNAPINCQYRDGAWKWPSNSVTTVTIRGKEYRSAKTTWTAEGLTLPMGHGFWYYNSSNETVNVSW